MRFLITTAVGGLGCSAEGPDPVWFIWQWQEEGNNFAWISLQHLLCFAPNLIIIFYNSIPSKKATLWISGCPNFYWQIMIFIGRIMS